MRSPKFCATSIAALALFVNGWPTPLNYGGHCPANITLNGMVSGGMPQSSVQYAFSYLDPAAYRAVTLAEKSGTLDGNGALRLSVPISMPGGRSWMKLTVRQGSSASTSTVAEFSIVCTDVQ
jgi:hypothetical protein